MMKRIRRAPFVFGVFAAWLAPAPAPAQAPEEERALDSVSIPAGRSPIPKATEWTSAPRVRLTRTSAAAAACRAYLVREWMRVRCPGEAFALSLLAGEANVAFWIDPKSREGEVMMPLRPGERHVVQLWKAGADATGTFAPEAHFAVQQYWIEGAKAPVVTIF